jgi:hypothetical protein
MNRIFALMIAVILTASAFAQSPEKMSYQAVIRNSEDNLLTKQQIGMQITMLQGSTTGTPVYTETQTPTTNANGLVTIEIGTGTTSDNFSTIDWSNGPYFIKTETDLTGGTSYTITATNQLLSVPYALHAKTAESISGNSIYIPFFSRSQIDSIIPREGQLVYNTTNEVTLMWNGSNWVQFSVNCFPQPTPADAGEDLEIITPEPTATLAANMPEEGTGTWSILRGNGGTFTDINDPYTSFSGNDCESYTLLWKIENVCSSSVDSVEILFNATPTEVSAGDDIYSPDHTTVTLNGNSLASGETGQWTVISGSGGSVSDPNSSNSSFTGTNNTVYVLRWTVSTACLSSYDEVRVYLGNVIGQYKEGGIICYVDGTGDHGLICAPSDLPKGTIQWGCEGVAIPGADGSAIGTGAQNTLDILAGCSTPGIAARLCTDLSLEGFDDWFLPSMDELGTMYQNKGEIDYTAINIEGTVLVSSIYVSSTEYSHEWACWGYNLGNGIQQDWLKRFTHGNVRAVRAF